MRRPRHLRRKPRALGLARHFGSRMETAWQAGCLSMLPAGTGKTPEPPERARSRKGYELCVTMSCSKPLRGACAGTPTTVVWSGTSRVTTAPAPITQ